MSHGDNTPSDWLAWVRRCDDCGERYHASEGCDCRRRWEEEDRRAEATLDRLPPDLAAWVRRALADMGEPG